MPTPTPTSILKEGIMKPKHLDMVLSLAEVRAADPLVLIKIKILNNERPGSPGNMRNLPNVILY